MSILKLNKKEQELTRKFFCENKVNIYHKNELISPINSVHRNVYYIEKGIIRVYYINSKGEEITHWLSLENEVVSVLSSMFDKSISPYGIQALEDTTKVRVLPVEKFIEQKETQPEVASIFEKMLISSAIQIANRLVAIQTQTAKERYNDLVKEKPEIFQRVNLGHLASYLGMTPQSLSRIRGQQ